MAGALTALLLACASERGPADKSGGRCSVAQVAAEAGLFPGDHYFELAVSPAETVTVTFMRRSQVQVGVPPRVSRWSLRRFPLHVSLDAGEPPPEIAQAQFEQAVRDSAAAWSGAIDGKLPTFVLESSSAAELPLRWVDTLDVAHALGETSSTLGPGHSQFKPDVIELPRTRPDGAPWTAELLRRVLVHEFGHALGIMGHSDNPADAMYPAEGSERSAPTSRDRNTLRMLYACPRDAFVDP